MKERERGRGERERRRVIEGEADQERERRGVKSNLFFLEQRIESETRLAWHTQTAPGQHFIPHAVGRLVMYNY